MSTSEFENRRLSARIFYHSNQSGQPMRPTESGPDVTNVANQTTLSMSLTCIQPTMTSSEQDSPDLVATGMILEGATALFHQPAPFPAISGQTSSTSTDTWKTASTTPSQPTRLSHCTGPSHSMYL